MCAGPVPGGPRSVRARLIPGSGYAQPMETREEPVAVAIDPVCGMDVEVAGAKHSASFQGIDYYFCGRGCRLEFEDDPEHFLDPEYVPAM
jgi:xanthine dehydrogenase accessory factor